MKLKPFKTLIAMSKEKLDEAMATPRAWRIKCQAELEMKKLEVDILNEESEAQEMLTRKDVYFPQLMDRLDRIALLQRRKEQYEKVLAELFPAEDSGD